MPAAFRPEFAFDLHVPVILANSAVAGMIIVGVVQQGATYEYVPWLESLHGRFVCHDLAWLFKFDLRLELQRPDVR
jgi:hypothetical protein